VKDRVFNLSLRGLDFGALMVATKDLIEESDGSTCKSSTYAPSQVLNAVRMGDDEADGCVRIRYCHVTPDVDWERWRRPSEAYFDVLRVTQVPMSAEPVG
jgi:cysteine desulfurase